MKREAAKARRLAKEYKSPVNGNECGIVSFTIDGWSPQEIRGKLAGQKMNVHVSSAASTRLDMDGRGLPRVVRASVHYYNAEEEMDRFCDFVSDFVRRNS